jgi:hypothetical protein
MTIMTSDHAAKKAARARMATTGEPYSAARRAVRGSGDALPDEVRTPPGVDPVEHAVQSRHWGESASHLVPHAGRYYAWITHPGRPPVVYRMRDQETGRRFLDAGQATELLRASWGKRIASLFLLDPADSTRIVYEAAVVNVADGGIWLACLDDTAHGDQVHPLAGFEDLGAALAEFADRAEAAADRIESEQATGSPELITAVLRYRAATVRAEAAAARLGDVIRQSEIRPHGDLPVAVHEAGLSRETLPGVLAGQDLAWPAAPLIRAPGARTGQTLVRTLATYNAGGRQYALVCYRDTAGDYCVAVDVDGQPGAFVCDVQAKERDLVSAGTTMAAGEHGTMVIYGGAHDSVTEVYAVTRDGQRTDWPVYDDPDSGKRYFAVIVEAGSVADVVAAAPGRQVSLQRYLGVWFGLGS